MTDPRDVERDRHTDELRYADRWSQDDNRGWIAAALLAVVLLGGLAIYGSSDRTISEDATTGRSERPPLNPNPALPARPAPAPLRQQ